MRTARAIHVWAKIFFLEAVRVYELDSAVADLELR
jgi:hypothetical protein